MTLTTQDTTVLTRVFDADDYEFKPQYSPKKAAEYGKQQYLTYVGEEAIIERLNAVDPAWSLTIDRVDVRGQSYSAYVTLTVAGVVRQGVGTGDGENGEKGAATDALKRAARLFGIGAHLKRAPKIWLDHTMKRWEAESAARTKIEQWLQGKDTPPAAPAPAVSAAAPAATITHWLIGADGTLNHSEMWKDLVKRGLRDEYLTRIEVAYDTTDIRNITTQNAVDAYEFVIAEATQNDTQPATPDREPAGKA